MTPPLLSICIPAYNRPAELREALSSVLTQDDPNLEVIVSDDSGNLADVVLEFDDARVKYFANEINLGMAANWSAALDRSTGSFVALLMDDDRLLPGFSRAARGVLAGDSSVGVVFTNHYFASRTRVWRRSSRLTPGRLDDFLPLLLEFNPVPISAAVMRREVWESLRPFPDQLTADFALFARAAMAGCVFYYLDERLMIYRVHDGQLSGSDRFRSDGVRLWKELRFDTDSAETLRLRRLRSALISRAASLVKSGDLESALSDLQDADATGQSETGVKAKILRILAGRPKLAVRVTRASATLGVLRNQARMRIAATSHRLSEEEELMVKNVIQGPEGDPVYKGPSPPQRP